MITFFGLCFNIASTFFTTMIPMTLILTTGSTSTNTITKASVTFNGILFTTGVTFLLPWKLRSCSSVSVLRLSLKSSKSLQIEMEKNGCSAASRTPVCTKLSPISINHAIIQVKRTQI